jgi:hypothetical protein
VGNSIRHASGKARLARTRLRSHASQVLALPATVAVFCNPTYLRSATAGPYPLPHPYQRLHQQARNSSLVRIHGRLCRNEDPVGSGTLACEACAPGMAIPWELACVPLRAHHRTQLRHLRCRCQWLCSAIPHTSAKYDFNSQPTFLMST